MSKLPGTVGEKRVADLEMELARLRRSHNQLAAKVEAMAEAMSALPRDVHSDLEAMRRSMEPGAAS